MHRKKYKISTPDVDATLIGLASPFKYMKHMVYLIISVARNIDACLPDFHVNNKPLYYRQLVLVIPEILNNTENYVLTIF